MKEEVRDDKCKELREALADVFATQATALGVTEQEAAIAAFQFAGAAGAAFCMKNHEGKHADNVGWMIRNVAGVYSEINGLEMGEFQVGARTAPGSTLN